MNAPLPLGLHRGIPAEQYHADPDSVSNTMLSAMNKSAAHCYALHLDPARPIVAPTDAMKRGTLTHTAILEPLTLAGRYIVKPADVDFRTATGKAWRDAQTRDIVTADDMAGAEHMRRAVLRVKALANLLSAGDAEASVFWKDKATGMRCRARPDWLHWHGPKRATVLDVKTIGDITFDAIQKAIATYGYHRQAAHYSNGLRAAGVEVEEFVFGFVSSSYPFIAAAYVLDDETAQQGADEVEELLGRFAECKARNEWPAFGDGYQLTGLPAWAKRTSEVEIEVIQ